MSELKLVDLTDKSKKRKNVSKKETPSKKVAIEEEPEVAIENAPSKEVVKDFGEIDGQFILEVDEAIDELSKPEKVKKPPTEKQLAAREAMKVKREAKKAELAEKAKAEALRLEQEAAAAAKKAEEKKLKAAERRRAKKEAIEAAEEAAVLKPLVKPKKPVGKSISEPFKNVEPPKVVAVEPLPRKLNSIVVPADYRRKKTNMWGKGTPFQGNKIF